MRSVYGLVLLIFGVMTAAVVEARTLTFCSEGDPETLSPIFNTNTTSLDVTAQMYEGLVAFKKGTTQIRPELAERWTISEDGLTYKFFLRKGVKWHTSDDFTPTRDVTADDVLFSIQRQWQPEHPFFKVSQERHPYFNDMNMGQVLQAVEKEDPYTVVIKLNRPVAPLLANLAMPWASIYSHEYAQSMMNKGEPQRIDERPIGTGPFQLVRYEKQKIVQFKPFDQYWGAQVL